ncbi:MAG: methylated-DNA--[protein]-cysteine S-methyltransferase [Nocardioidaceae bacterium]
MIDAMVVDSPVGPLELASDGERLTHVSFLDDAQAPGEGAHAAVAVLAEVKRQLEQYFTGELTSFHLPLAAAGTEFQQRVWAELWAIPYGQTVSYKEVAARLGLAPGASRAVGLANGANPIPIIVPCHRVVGADGTLTGYGGGLERKRFLLDLEKPVTQATLFD